MTIRKISMTMFLLMIFTASAHAQVFGTVRGTVVDPQQRVIPAATVTLKAHASAWTKQGVTDEEGMFTISAVPADSYLIEIVHDGFQPISRNINVTIGSAPMLEFTMSLGSITQSVAVTAPLEITNPEASSPPVSVNEGEILHAPGADRAASIAFITNFVPGSFLLHDHLHVRGGHQVSWLIDGVPVPNTNLSSNIGRQIDPKDIENVEISTGGYKARYGDRTYGIVNIVPRSGFEFENREFVLTTGFGSLNQTNNQLSFGGHGANLAYYGSIGGNRTDLGLEPPDKNIIHNTGNGLTGFTTLHYSLSPFDQLRFTGSLRRDHYWVPNTAADQAAGFRDVNNERDAFGTFAWVRTFNPRTLLSVSPFYRYNGVRYDGWEASPLITKDNRITQYFGSQVALSYVPEKHNAGFGTYFFHQRDKRSFGLTENQGARFSVTERQKISGNLWSTFFDDQYKPWRWLALNGGLRVTHYSGDITENAVNPRIGATVEVPRLRWVLRGYFGTYYQAPPLSTLSGPILEFAAREGFGYLPVQGERDQQREFGLTIPIRGFAVSVSHFRTNAENFSDHDVLGNSNITFPVTIQTVRSRGTELLIHTPEFKRAHVHVAYSNMIVKGRGTVSGGMTNFEPPAEGTFYVDHDQRHTFTTGADINLPRAFWINANLTAGSGFLDGDGPRHLPSHASIDVAGGKQINQNLSATFTVLNIGNTRYLLGRESSFAGTHYNEPRQFTVQLRYRFHL